MNHMFSPAKQESVAVAGKPWDMAKAFDRTAPCGAIGSVADVGHSTAGGIELRVNGEVRQASDLSDMIWSVPAIISALSLLVELAPGI